MAKPFEAAGSASGVSGPPSAGDYFADRIFRAIAWTSAFLIIVLMAYILWEIGREAVPAMGKYGLGFVTGTTWNVNKEEFGVLPEIWGTLYSSLLALILGGTFGIAIAILLTQDFIHHRLATVFRTIVEMLAAIPSVVFGLWGIYVLIPLLKPVAEWLHGHVGWFPLFDTDLAGPGMAPAALVLAIMILPTVAAISVDAFRRIPYKVKEAAYGMGTTRWEAILKVMLPTASSGILAALVLGFGRALGETMALAMLIGNANQISLSLFSPANTLASLLASTFPEAGQIEVQALMYAALVLLRHHLPGQRRGSGGPAVHHSQVRGQIMSAIDLTPSADEDRPVPQLGRKGFEARALKSGVLTGVTWIAAVLAAVPLFSVIYLLLANGGARLFGADFAEVLTGLPPAGFEQGGGIGPAIVGTLAMVGIGAVISIPIGVLAAVYLGVLEPRSKMANTSRFLAKVLTGFPSIMAGVFVYAVLVKYWGYSAWAGGIALSVLMLRTVVLAAEEAIAQVPQRMKDAAYGMGCTRSQVIWKVVLPTGLPGILTGVLLAVAGAAGESAPLLFTALFSNYYISQLSEPTASLSILIYNFSGMPFANQIELAWTASLVLVLIVLGFNILARLIGQPKV